MTDIDEAQTLTVGQKANMASLTGTILQHRVSTQTADQVLRLALTGLYDSDGMLEEKAQLFLDAFEEFRTELLYVVAEVGKPEFAEALAEENVDRSRLDDITIRL